MKRSLGGLCAVVVLVIMFFIVPAKPVEAAPSSYIDLDQYQTQKSFAAGSEYRTSVRKLPNGDGQVRLTGNPLTATDTARTYNGGRYYWGRLLSPVHKTSTPFDTLIPSWNVNTPRGTWVQVMVRVRSGGQWSRWFVMGVWASGTSDIKRHSVNGQSDAKWRLDTDTLRARSGAKAEAYQYHLKLMSKDRGRSPVFTKMSVLASNSSRHGTRLVGAPLKAAWGDNLRVPARSQMIYANGGEVWCSPTSLSMVMAYWSNKTGRKNLNQSVPTVARGTYDSAYRGWGNWPFNTAYASAYGLESTVSRFSSIEQVERWIDTGVPVIASVAWDNRSSGSRLSGAPLQRSGGHLMVIKGFTRSGNVIVNDPAASSNAGVPRVYNRAEFSRAWLRTGSGGVVYLVHPKEWRTPYTWAARGSW